MSVNDGPVGNFKGRHEDGSARDELEPAHPERGWAGDERRTIHVRLTSDEYWELRQRAHSAGLRPWDLARHWIIAQLDRPEASDREPDLTYEIETLSGMIADQRGAIDHLVRRLDRIERALSPGGLTDRLTPPRQPGANASGAFGSGRSALAHEPHPKLHEEILAVLHDVGEPMSSEAIAEEVTRRGRYRARSGHALSAAAISGRIANPRYRGMFHRDGRMIRASVSASSARLRD